MRTLIDKLWEVSISVLPITLLVLILHWTLAPLPQETILKFLIGTVFIILGLGLFHLGTEIGILPMGQRVGAAMTKSRRLWIIITGGFLIGFMVTVAEPDLQVLAGQIAQVSEGEIERLLLIAVVAVGTGIFTAFGLLRIVFQIPLKKVLLIGYSLVFLLALFTAPKFFAVSFDSGGVTTGPMTVPFILSLGIGVASVARGRSADSNSFGLVALASIGPVLAVLLLGVLFR